MKYEVKVTVEESDTEMFLKVEYEGEELASLRFPRDTSASETMLRERRDLCAGAFMIGLTAAARRVYKKKE